MVPSEKVEMISFASSVIKDIIVCLHCFQIKIGCLLFT